MPEPSFKAAQVLLAGVFLISMFFVSVAEPSSRPQGSDPLSGYCYKSKTVHKNFKLFLNLLFKVFLLQKFKYNNFRLLKRTTVNNKF